MKTCYQHYRVVYIGNTKSQKNSSKKKIGDILFSIKNKVCHFFTSEEKNS